jgi:hypothetical protein
MLHFPCVKVYSKVHDMHAEEEERNLRALTGQNIYHVLKIDASGLHPIHAHKLTYVT